MQEYKLQYNTIIDVVPTHTMDENAKPMNPLTERKGDLVWVLDPKLSADNGTKNLNTLPWTT